MAYDGATYLTDPTTLTTPRERLTKLTTPRERLEYLRDFLLRLPDERFNMKGWYTRDGEHIPTTEREAAEHVSDCGTAACIAGWGMALFTPKHMGAPSGILDEKLGLTWETANNLYYPPNFYHMPDYTPRQAARVIDHLINTGEVDWSVAGAP